MTGRPYLVGPNYAGIRITLRLDGRLMHAIVQGVLALTAPYQVTLDRLHKPCEAHTVSTSLPPPPLPAGSIREQPRVGTTGRMMVGKQRMKLGRATLGRS